MNLLWRRSYSMSVLWSSLFVLLMSTAGALGQMSDEQFRALQERAIREKWSFTVKRNEATKRPLSELCGLVEPLDWQKTARFVSMRPLVGVALPASFDWRGPQANGLPPIRNQGHCGSCWAFATIGALECNIRIKDNVTANLAEQWLISCNRSGWSCGGGWVAYDYLQVGGRTDSFGGNGAPYDSEFPYAASDLPCNGPYPHHYWIQDWAYIGSSRSIPSVGEMKQAILTYGPIWVAVSVDDAFHVYDSGIFTGNSSGINHAVVLVGWNDNGGTNGYWILRNSWGSSWGESGYMRIKYGCNMVGYGACYIDYGALNVPRISPNSGFTARGPEGGPFLPGCQTYTLSNSDARVIHWTARKTANWISLSSMGGSLASGALTNVDICVNENANALSGDYFDTIIFSNTTSGAYQTRSVILHAGLIDYFTEIFDAMNNDLDNQQFTFTPDGSVSRYSVCKTAAASFPTLPTGGTNINLSDEGYATVTLSGGESVWLYTNSYTRLYVHANGYITLGSSDSGYTETLLSHFSKPRVSALFDDLNPGAGGTMNIRQTSDRLAVTYQNVPEFGATNRNSFQIEMFFDGRIRITYLQIDALDGLVGLSQGNGVPINFIESDFTSYPACGPDVGSVRAFIMPAEAVFAGAQWQLNGGTWRNSGEVIADVPGGPQTISYKVLANWTKPADQSMSVYQNQITTVTGGYVFTSADLGNAIDAPTLTWQTGGNSIWFSQTGVTHDGADAARSGEIEDNEQSWIQMVVPGSGTLSFWWKVSSETSGLGRNDFLGFYVDGVEQAGSITGEVNWTQRMLNLSSGIHTARWAYVKDGADSVGSDGGWVDQVVFTPQTLFNLALASRGSTITGSNGSNWEKLIDGVTTGYTSSVGFGYTLCSSFPGTMTLDLKSLCALSSTKLLLWDLDNRYYRYKIEASSNNMTWVMIVDRTSSGMWQSWQDIRFSPGIQARYLRLTGTYDSIPGNNGFHVVEWEVYGALSVPPATYTITPAAGANGSILPGTPVTLDAGQSASFVVSAATTNFYIASLTTNGGEVWGVAGLYTYTSWWNHVQANGAITAAFASVTGNTATNGASVPWLRQYYTNEANLEALKRRANEDTDGDGMLTWKEYWSRTDPKDSKKFLHLTTIQGASDSTGSVVQWTSETGIVYRLTSSTNLLTDLFTTLVSTNIPATPPTNVATDKTAVGKAVLYYRIGVER